jgi:hypothetical protein
MSSSLFADSPAEVADANQEPRRRQTRVTRRSTGASESASGGLSASSTAAADSSSQSINADDAAAAASPLTDSPPTSAAAQPTDEASLKFESECGFQFHPQTPSSLLRVLSGFSGFTDFHLAAPYLLHFLTVYLVVDEAKWKAMRPKRHYRDHYSCACEAIKPKQKEEAVRHIISRHLPEEFKGAWREIMRKKEAARQKKLLAGSRPAAAAAAITDEEEEEEYEKEEEEEEEEEEESEEEQSDEEEEAAEKPKATHRPTKKAKADIASVGAAARVKPIMKRVAQSAPFSASMAAAPALSATDAATPVASTSASTTSAFASASFLPTALGGPGPKLAARATNSEAAAGSESAEAGATLRPGKREKTAQSSEKREMRREELHCTALN